jgi:uncharacterized membrane protein
MCDQRVAAVRGWRERAIQALAYEAGGLALFAPLWALATGASGAESLTVLVSLSLVVMAWMSAYNTLFDHVEARLTRRVASDRPHRWRLVHAAGLEVTSIAATTPLIVHLGGFGWMEALAADVALTLAYCAYGYVFHLGFDRLRPVAARPEGR